MPDSDTPTLTQLERTSIPVEQFLGLLNFENKGRLVEQSGGIGAGVRHGNPQFPKNFFLIAHIIVQAAAEISGYNAQYFRRLLRAGRLEGDKIGQVWLIGKAFFEDYLTLEKSANDRRFGPKTNT